MRMIRRRKHARELRTRASAVLAVAGVSAMTAGLVVFSAPAASAHTPQISATCAGVTATGSHYESEDTNTLSVTLDGDTRTTAFATSGSLTVPVPQDGETHTWSASVHTTNPNTVYTKSSDGAVGPCGSKTQIGDPRPAVTPPTCTTDGSVSWPEFDHGHWSGITGTGPGVQSATPVADKGYALSDSHKVTVTVSPKGSGQDCREVVAVPGAPEATPASCQAAGSLDLPADTSKIDWGISPALAGPGDYTVSADTVTGFTFPNGSTHKTWPLTLAPQSHGGACRALLTPVAPEITQSRCTGPGTGSEAGVVLADRPSSVDYDYDGHTHVVTATVTDDDHRFADDLPQGWHRTSDTVATLGVHLVDAGACLVDRPVRTEPSVTPASCSSEGHLVLPTSDAYSWTEGAHTPADTAGDHTVTAVASSGYSLVGTTSFDLHVPERGEGFDCRGTSTPTAPAVVESHCTGPGQSSQPSVDLPATEGIDYAYDASSHTATATTDSGHKLATGLPQGWVHATDSDAVATYVVSFADVGGCLVEVTPLYPSTTPPSCSAAGTLIAPDPPTGVGGTRTGDVPGEVTFRYVADPGYVLAGGVDTSRTVTVLPRKSGVRCGTVKGTEESTPKPGPTSHHRAEHGGIVLGTEASAPVAVPTVVDAGLAGAEAPGASSVRELLAGGLLVGGALLLMGAFAPGFGRRHRGSQQV